MTRKAIIGAAALAVAVLLFVGYIRLTGTKGIRVSDTSGIADIPDKPLTGQARQIDKTTVHSVQQSRYIILDPQTKRMKRVFGFESLLNASEESNNWQVRRPYMNVFESRFRCRLDAEEGAVQVEYSGGDVIPKDARLMGRVVIRLLPTDEKRFGETVILLDDLNYSSERSEFFTDGPVQLISAQTHLVGKGMQMIYNPQNGRIEYFRIKDIESVRIRKVVTSNLLGQSSSQPPLGTGKAEPAVSTVPSSGNAEKTATLNTTSQQKADPNANSAVKRPDSSQDLYYVCSLRNNVKIRYGKQVVVQGAEEVNILNLLWGSQTTGTSPAQPAAQAVSTEPNGGAAPQQSIAAANQSEPQISDDWSRRTQLPDVPADDDETDVLATCAGGIVVKPMDSAFDPAKESSINNFSQAVNVQENVAVAQTLTAASKAPPVEELSDSTRKPAQFEAQKLDYDSKTGSAVAQGPIRFLFYTPADANDPASSLPVVITAQRNTEFLADAKKSIRQVIFHDNVIGDATKETANEKTVRRFYGQTLTVDLTADTKNRTKVSHVAVADGNAKLQAIRYRDGAKINHVELHSEQFDYEDAQRSVIAVGPGKIELNNQQVPADAKAAAQKQSLDLRQPCYALVEGFDKLTWKISEQKMLAEARRDTLNLSYLTMKDNVPDKLTYAAVSNAELHFAKDDAGKSILSELTADGGVYLEQKDEHILTGQTLHYTGKDGWIHIEGTESRPCFVDGARAPVIDYNFRTGQLKTKLSRSPSAVTSPQK